MEAYSAFAGIYDEFMDNIPYGAWEGYILRILKKYGIESGIVAELGCGTGNMTRRLARHGYDMIGIDISEEMLAEARRHEDNGGILYVNQDMRELELFGTVNAVISVCDSINYILSYNDLREVFKRVNNYLEKDGLFIFDMKTPYFYREVLKDSVQVDSREDACLIWENFFDEKSLTHTYDLTMFISAGDGAGGLFRRYTERHRQRAYSVDTVKKAIKSAGLELAGVYKALAFDEPDGDVERIYFVAREGYQDGKYYA